MSNQAYVDAEAARLRSEYNVAVSNLQAQYDSARSAAMAPYLPLLDNITYTVMASYALQDTAPARAWAVPHRIYDIPGMWQAYAAWQSAHTTAVDTKRLLMEASGEFPNPGGLSAESYQYNAWAASYIRAHPEVTQNQQTIDAFHQANAFRRPLYQQYLRAQATLAAYDQNWLATHPDPFAEKTDSNYAAYQSIVASWEAVNFPPVEQQQVRLKAALDQALDNLVRAANNTSGAGATMVTPTVPPANSAYAPNYGANYGSTPRPVGFVDTTGWLPVYTSDPSHPAAAGSHGQGPWLTGYMVPPPGYSPNGGSYQLVPVTYSRQIPAQPYIPPRPPVPAVSSQLILDMNLGWNSSAVSSFGVPPFCRVSVRFPSTVIGVMFGIAEDAAEFDGKGYSNMNLALYVSKRSMQLYKFGVRDQSFGNYMLTEDTIVTIERDGRKVTISTDDGFGPTEQYMNETEFPDPDALLFVDASLYAAGDEFDMFGIAALSRASMEMKPLLVAGYDGVPIPNQGALSFEPMVVYSRARRGTALSMRPMEVWASDRPIGRAALTMLPPVLTHAESGLLQPSWGIGHMYSELMTVGGRGMTGGVGNASLTLEPTLMLASGGVGKVAHAHVAVARLAAQPMRVSAYGGGASPSQYSGAALYLEPPRVFAYGPERDLVTYGSAALSMPALRFSGLGEDRSIAASNTPLFMLDPWYIEQEFSIAMRSVVDVSSPFSLVEYLLAELMSALSVVTDPIVDEVQSVEMSSPVLIDFLPPAYPEATTTVVASLLGLTTRYEGYDFSGFAMIAGKPYGIRPDGIYLLEGDDDAGVPIAATINFGKSDFGTSLLKSCVAAYAEMSAGHKLQLKLRFNGQEYVYKSRSSEEFLATQRFDLGRGVRASLLEFELSNRDGEHFELNSLEPVIVPLSRRI